MAHRLFRSRPGVPTISFFLAFVASASVFGSQGLTFPPNGDNSQASVIQAIGPVRVTIDYSSPRVVRGPNDRRGKIWGELVPWGLSDLGLNGCSSCPWRGGANENTTFTVTHDVKVQGQPLPAGTYGLHFIPGKEDWTVIFSKDASSWGSYWYDAKQDALRVQVKPVRNEYREWLTYEFTEREPGAAPYLATLHNYTFGGLLSLGFGGASISGMKYSIPRLVSGVTGSLFLEDRAAHFDSLRRFAEREF